MKPSDLNLQYFQNRMYRSSKTRVGNHEKGTCIYISFIGVRIMNMYVHLIDWFKNHEHVYTFNILV